MELKITEEHGWSRSVKLDKSIIRIGSSTSNDVQLQSSKVAPVHLQILYSPDILSSCRALCLSECVLRKGEGEKGQVISAGVHEVGDGDEIIIGEYTLSFHLPLAASTLRNSEVIGASLCLPDAVLQPNSPLNGSIMIKNAGNQNASQFQVMINGLPQDCYQIDPVPLLYPGAQEQIRIQLYHHTTYPEAGLHEIEFCISAPDDYPGEELVIQQGIYIAPVFKQALGLVDDLAVGMPIEEQAIAPFPEIGEKNFESSDFQPVVPTGEQPVAGDPARLEDSLPPEMGTDLVKDHYLGEMTEEINARSSEAPEPEPEPWSMAELVEAPPAVSNDEFIPPETESPLLPNASPIVAGHDETPPIEEAWQEVTPTSPQAHLQQELDVTKLKVVRYQEEPVPLADIPHPEGVLKDGRPLNSEEKQPLKPKPGQDIDLSKMKVIRDQPNEFWDEG